MPNNESASKFPRLNSASGIETWQLDGGRSLFRIFTALTFPLQGLEQILQGVTRDAKQLVQGEGEKKPVRAKNVPLSVIRKMLKGVKNIDACLSTGDTLLTFFARSGSVQMVQILLDAGAEVNARNAEAPDDDLGGFSTEEGQLSR
jgi:ankyrin repeat protein